MRMHMKRAVGAFPVRNFRVHEPKMGLREVSMVCLFEVEGLGFNVGT